MSMSDKKIKILQVTPDLGIGGLPKLVVDICKNIDKSIFDISVFCFKKCEEEFTPELIKNNIGVHFPSRENNRRSSYLNFFQLYQFIEKDSIDIVHTHNTAAFVDGIIAAKMARVPINIHTDHARLYPDKRRYMFAEWLFSHFTTKIVAVSEHTQDELIKYEKISPHKIQVIPNGIDETEYNLNTNNRKKEELGIQENYPILGLGVRLTEQKGVTYLIQSMVSIINKFPKALLLIAGGGPLQENLEREAKRLGLSQSVKFLGFRLDMPAILNILDIYVLPSLWEGLPLVILEAMAAQKAIVATAVGGTPTAIINERSGLLVNPRNPEALAQAIIRLLEDPSLAAHLAKNAYQRYQEKFTIQKMVSQYEKLYFKSYHNNKRINTREAIADDQLSQL